MNFSSWSTLESITDNNPTQVSSIFRDYIEKETGKETYFFPEFDKFTRNGEPTQIGYLITTDDLRSMRLNFVDTNLYSIDIWNGKGLKPALTLYLNSVPVDKALPKIMYIYKNPTKISLQESSDEIKIVSSKEAKEAADKSIDNAQKDLDYDYGDPDVVFDDMTTYIDMVIEGAMNSLLLTGQAGVGKSFLVMKRLEANGLKRNEDYFKITGKTTAAGLYISLYENNGKMLIYDDCDSVFKDPTAVNVLKGALDTSVLREISWNAAGAALKTDKKNQIPKKFDFNGKIIFISNVPRKKIDAAIRSRAFMLEIALTKEDMISRMWDLLPEIETPKGLEVSGAIKDKSMLLLTQAAEETTDVELNLRTLLKTIAIVSKVKSDDIALRMIKQQCSL